ncbi:MAG: molybdopterin-dependent oxidoreductase [Actinomycetota bacterium]
MGRKPLMLFVLAAVLIAASMTLFFLRQVGAEDHLAVTYEEVLSLPATTAVYHSINNWQTVEDTGFTGVDLFEFLEEQGIDEDGAEVRLIAPDGYFWPAVGTTLTLGELKEPNAAGLYPLLAWEMDGNVLQPEPDGSGPLRLVMPQYSEDEVNKPSWVSNVRLIEIGPVGEEVAVPDAARVPVDEVWIYGDVPTAYPFSAVYPVIALLAGVLVLAAAILARMADKKRKRDVSQVVAAVVLAAALVAAAPIALPHGSVCEAGPGSRIFSMGELAAMPAFAGHYTFLKSQEPFTYYEADYRGVPLSYLIEERMSLAPGASGVKVIARDGYEVSLSLADARKVYPGGLKVIIAYEKDGAPLVGDEGPLRLIVPQSVPGSKDQGGEPNTPLCARMVYAVEVEPVPAGERPPGESEVPAGSLAVYGAVSEPAPQPQPAPTPVTPQPAPVSPGDNGQEREQAQPDPAATAPGTTATAVLGGNAALAFGANWMVLAAIQAQPLKAVMPLLYLFWREGKR